MKSLVIISLCLFSLTSFSQKEEDQEAKHPIGIGLRVGDFNGISTQYFLTEQRISFELNIGRSYFFGDNYEKRFEQYAEKNAIEYLNYHEERAFEGASLGFKFNIAKYGNIGNVPHFYWYGGTGFQLRNFKLDHSYSIPITAANSSIVKASDITVTDVKHSSYGLDFIIGSEYVFQEFPMSVFVDLSTFVEMAELRQNLMGQMGFGVRVHF